MPDAVDALVPQNWTDTTDTGLCLAATAWRAEASPPVLR
jgi:hypothetical protein